MENEIEKFRAILYYLWKQKSELRIYIGNNWRNEDFSLLLYNITVCRYDYLYLFYYYRTAIGVEPTSPVTVGYSSHL